MNIRTHIASNWRRIERAVSAGIAILVGLLVVWTGLSIPVAVSPNHQLEVCNGFWCSAPTIEHFLVVGGLAVGWLISLVVMPDIRLKHREE